MVSVYFDLQFLVLAILFCPIVSYGLRLVKLAACSLELIKKFLRALQVGRRQLAMVHREPWQQVIVFNSFHLLNIF